MEVTSRTSEISTQNQSLIVKTTTVISQASSNGTTNGETNQISEGQQVNSKKTPFSHSKDTLEKFNLFCST